MTASAYEKTKEMFLRKAAEHLEEGDIDAAREALLQHSDLIAEARQARQARLNAKRGN